MSKELVYAQKQYIECLEKHIGTLEDLLTSVSEDREQCYRKCESLSYKLTDTVHENQQLRKLLKAKFKDADVDIDLENLKLDIKA